MQGGWGWARGSQAQALGSWCVLLSCWGPNCVPTNLHVRISPKPPASQDVFLFGDRVFKEVS